MPNTFTISTTGSNIIALDTARQGTFSLTATNVSGQPLKARGYIVADNASSPDWFKASAAEVRDIPAGGTEQYAYSVTVPADKPAGTYTFHFSIVGVGNPDEQFAQGPEMSFVVSAAPVRAPVKKGYVESVVGALVGALAGGALGVLPGLVFILTTGHISDLGQGIGDVVLFLLLAGIGAFLGIWAGSALGVWSVLRSRKYEYPGTTGGLMVVLTLILLVVTALLSGIFHLSEVLGTILDVLLFGLAIAGAALAARAVTLLLRARQV